MSRLSLLPAIGTLLAALYTAGCAHRPEAFRLTVPANGPILVPPDAKDVTVVRARLRIGPVPRKTVCPPSPHGLLVQRKWLTGPRVVVTRDAMGATTGPELFAWTVELEKQGCIAPNQAFQLAERIIDALPLRVSQRSKLVEARGDLTSRNSLRVVAPVLQPGASFGLSETTSVGAGSTPGSLVVELKTNPGVIGYEVDWYDLAAQGAGPGYRVVPRSAETHVDDKVGHPASPTTQRFQFGSDSRWYELYMMTKVSQNDFDFVVLSARTPSELADDVAWFQRDSEAFLRAADPASYTILPYGTGINAYIRVRVNGVFLDLPRGATIRQAVGQAADPRAPLTRLKIRKLHNGTLYPVEWDRKSEQILSLPLEGGEEIDF